MQEMTHLPAFVFRSPGAHRKPTGGTYGYISVQTQSEFDDKLASGWFATSAEAIQAAGENATPKPRVEKKPTPVKKRTPSKPLDGINHRLIKEQQAIKETPKEPVVEIDNAPPTRAEMEAKATELGIKFDGRSSDKTLLAKIEEALGE